MPMNAKTLVNVYTATKQQYDTMEGNNEAEVLKERVRTYLTDNSIESDVTDIKKVVDMYLEVKERLSNNHASYSDAPYSQSPRDTSEHSTSWFSMPNFTYNDNRWIWGSYNTTNNITSSNPNHQEEKSSLEQMLMQIGIIIFLGIVAILATVLFKDLFYEIFQHVSRLWNNEGTFQGSLLLMGIATSYCLSMLSLYLIAGQFLMATMMMAGFANPAVWTCSAITLAALIVTPLFNMMIREGIYTLFSQFDDQALVSTDNRFRVLTQTEIDNLPDNIDPDRINFATLCKYDELKPTQKRQPFAFFDYNSPRMNHVLEDIRAMRTAKKETVDIKRPDSSPISFCLKKTTFMPSAPPIPEEIPEAQAVYA